ncbi:MAG: polysaccharide deacetylase family protein [candidate division Zixibacteria bacterium]|nr:polysaccharide deacetylase family protein [candidate division Zixibacteria bacterium]
MTVKYILNHVKAISGLLALILLLVSASAVDIGADEKGKKSGKKALPKEICITFDELPVAESFAEEEPERIMRPILDTLNAHKVRAAGFVVGHSMGRAYDLFGEWLNSGHRMGSMTFSHSDLHEMSIEQFIRDTEAGFEALETMLSGFGQKPRFFRYPFLHYGKEVTSREDVSRYLEDRGVMVVHATVVVEDYLYNLSLQKLGSRPDSSSLNQLLNEYVNHVLDQIETAEALSKKLNGRSCRHILQLRANRLNALFLGEMLTAIEQAGYEFITLDRALKDKVYIQPQAYFGPRGIGYLDMIDQSDPDRLPAQ